MQHFGIYQCNMFNEPNYEPTKFKLKQQIDIECHNLQTFLKLQLLHSTNRVNTFDNWNLWDRFLKVKLRTIVFRVNYRSYNKRNPKPLQNPISPVNTENIDEVMLCTSLINDLTFNSCDWSMLIVYSYSAIKPCHRLRL